MKQLQLLNLYSFKYDTINREMEKARDEEKLTKF